LVAVLVAFLSIAPVIEGQVCVEPPAGLQAWWTGDGNASDVYGALGGALVGDATYGAGKVGQAFSFDGTGDWVEMSDASAGDFGDDAFTVDFWLYANSMGATDTYLVGKSHPDGGAAHGWDIRLGNGTIKVVGVNGWAVNIVSAALVDTGQWHHIAVAASASQVILYIDGDQAGSSGRSTITTAPNPLRFGMTTNYGGIALNGLIDEVEIFNRALNPTEVQSIYNAGAAGKCRPCTTLPTDAISWWRGEDDATDDVGDNDGTPAGDATYATGKVGQAFSFGGAGHVALPKVAQWDFGTSSFSIAAWFKSDTAGYRNIIRYHDGGGSSGWWGVRLETTGRLHFLLAHQTGSPNNQTVTSDDVVADGTWHHVAAVRDAEGGLLRLYVDGAEAATPIADAGHNVAGDADTNAAIGAGLWGDSGDRWEPFVGEIDEVAVFDRALTRTEIEAMANAGASGVCASCTEAPSDIVSWWRGEDDATDAVGDNHGSPQNNATFATGLIGSAISLPSGNDFVEVPHHSSLSFGSTEPMSIDFWAYRTTDDWAQHILSKRYDCYSTPFNYQLSWIPSQDGLCFGGTSGGYVCATGDIFPLATWTHIAVVFDGSAGTIYVNGQQQAVATMTLGPDTNNPPLRFGSVADCDTLNYGFRGLLDEIEIHDRALSLGEIQAISNAGAYGKCEIVIVPEIFDDDFETGDTSAWTLDTNPT
jgi:hypothetical protein